MGERALGVANITLFIIEENAIFRLKIRENKDNFFPNQVHRLL